MTLYADDPDVYVDYSITDSIGGDNDWDPVTVEADDVDLTGTWQGDPGPTRTLRVPLAGLPTGSHDLRLIVPGGNDLSLGRIVLR